MDRFTLIRALEHYETGFSEEKTFAPSFLALLTHPRCFYRDHLPGHFTGSSWIVSKDRSKVLMVHHAKLNRWLQPGGHADGSEDLLAVSRKEALEETGIDPHFVRSTLFDIDLHPIPARKDFPQHDHYDVRFLFEADEHAPIRINHESNDVRWIPLNELENYNNSPSIVRMKKKLFGGNQ